MRAVDKLIKRRIGAQKIYCNICCQLYLVWCLIHIYRYACAKQCYKEKLHSVKKRNDCKRKQVLRNLLHELMYSTHHEIMRVVHDSSARTNEKIIINSYSAFILLK